MGTVNLIRAVAPSDEPARDDAVERKIAWLRSHPGGIVGRPNPRELGMAATVNGTVVATAYADLGILMSNVARAEAGGGCPLHPRGAPS